MIGEELTKLHKLHVDGVLSEDEFKMLKKRLISGQERIDGSEENSPMFAPRQGATVMINATDVVGPDAKFDDTFQWWSNTRGTFGQKLVGLMWRNVKRASGQV